MFWQKVKFSPTLALVFTLSRPTNDSTFALWYLENLKELHYLKETVCSTKSSKNWSCQTRLNQVSQKNYPLATYYLTFFYLNDIISRFIISSQEEAISYWHVRNRGHWGKRHGFETLISDLYNLKGYITVGYRGTFAIGRGDMSTTGFRKLTRILVCGKSALCREVFKVKL